MFKKVLIANRGEIALRVIRTCKEMGIKTVAVYSTVDAESLHVKFADEAVCIGPAPSSQSYLKMANIIAAAEITNADAIHPGYGFLSENPDFAALCNENGLIFIGPSAQSIRDMGLKTVAKTMARNAGLPLVPGSDGPVDNVDAARQFADKFGYPVILKASAGGGGRGMRIVEKADTIERHFKSAKEEALAAFGNGDIFVEKYLTNPKHIEFQILGDKHGNVIHLGERECSLQRKHQKLIEEAPSANISEAKRKTLGDLSLKFAKEIGYFSAGTIEFIMDEDGSAYFMEMNTRIQVEHPVTEMITGVDIVDWQIKIALNEKLTLKQDDIKINGWSIECRVNTEDPQNRFSPQTGLIDRIHFPQNAHTRIETGVLCGSVITPYFDSMIAKIIVHGEDRNDAIEKMYEALKNFSIVGIKTTVPFFKAVLKHPDFIDASYTTRWIDQSYSPEMLENEDDELIGVLAATIMYASEYLQLQGDIPAYKNDSLNVWVLNKRLNY